MELIKKNIHMERIRLHSNTQVALEEDINIPDSKPDVGNLIYEKGKVQIEEVKPTEDHVTIRGRLLFSVLYQTGEEDEKLVTLEGKIPFEEQLYTEGVKGGDTVVVKSKLDDLSVNTINSRKLSVQALISLDAFVEELYDEEAPVDFYFNEENTPLEYRKSSLELAQMAVKKNDIFRIRQEVTLPQNYPNVFHILWQDIRLEEVEFKPLPDNVSIQGDIHVFVLYEGEGEDSPIRAYETVIPFSGNLECSGCKDGMIEDISYEIGHMDLEVRPDFDGEERVLGLEMVLDIAMKLYEEEELEMVSDVYGVISEVESIEKPVDLQKLLVKIGGKSKVSGRMKIRNPKTKVLQLLHSEGKVDVDEQKVTEEGITIEGSVTVCVMYVTGDDASPYDCVKETFPFTYQLEIMGIQPEDQFLLHTNIQDLQVMMIDSEEMDVKMILDFHAVVFRKIPCKIISSLKITPLDMTKVNDLPGMVMFIAGNEDNLWNIGKQYYVPVSRIKEVNDLTSDEIHPGDKLLIVKG